MDKNTHNISPGQLHVTVLLYLRQGYRQRLSEIALTMLWPKMHGHSVQQETDELMYKVRFLKYSWKLVWRIFCQSNRNVTFLLNKLDCWRGNCFSASFLGSIIVRISDGWELKPLFRILPSLVTTELLLHSLRVHRFLLTIRHGSTGLDAFFFCMWNNVIWCAGVTQKSTSFFGN